MAPESDAASPIPSKLANGRFTVEGRLGKGCFGEVLVGQDKETGLKVAVKVEDLLSGYLDYEIAVLKKLQLDSLETSQGFARLLHSGVEGGGSHRCLVMERLGNNLLQCMQAAGGSLSVTTTVLVAEQALSCLEFLHSKRIVHCDVKPENFLTGLQDRVHHLYLVDFGLASEYHDGRNHLPQRSLAEFRGNFRFASMAAHRCLAPCRRDDLEALGYMLVFLAKGSLPWSGLSSEDWRMRNRRILELKEGTDPSILAAGLPEVFQDFLAEVRQLAYSERPDYLALLDLFAEERDQLADELGTPIKDHDLDWVKKEELVAPIPIYRRVNVVQPDDSVLANAIKRAISRGSQVSRKMTLGRDTGKDIGERTPSRTPSRTPRYGGRTPQTPKTPKTPKTPATHQTVPPLMEEKPSWKSPIERLRMSCVCSARKGVSQPQVFSSSTGSMSTMSTMSSVADTL